MKEKSTTTKNISNKLKNFIDKISYIGESKIPDDFGKIYYSKIDGSYLTRVGMEENLNFLLKHGVTEQIQNYKNIKFNTANIGFNPKEQKWYGCSHRAIFGFGIGSECKLGNVGFEPSNKEEFKQKYLIFWGDLDMNSDTYKTNPIAEEVIQDGKLGVLVKYTYNEKTPNEKIRGTIGSIFTEYPKNFGKGEWKAKTLEEAKQMAIDFAKNIS